MAFGDRAYSSRHFVGFDTESASKVWSLRGSQAGSLASGGCGKYVAAWALDLAGLLLGMVWPIYVIRAFAAGRTMRNVYRFDLDEISDMDLVELRKMLTRPDGRDRWSTVGSVALFIGYLLLAIPVGAGFLLLVIFSLPIWSLTKDEVPVR